MSEIPVAGVDVSKDFSDMCIIGPDNSVFERVKIFHDETSMKRSIGFLQKAERAFGAKPILVMEATGHYHRILHQFVTQHGYQAVVINPLQSSALKNLNIRKIKNDQIDAYRIALLYRTNSLKASLIPTDKIENLRMLCRQHHVIKNDITAYEQRLHALLDQVFPKYSSLFSRLTGKTSMAVLSCYPTPESLCGVHVQTLAKKIGVVSRRGKGYSETLAKKLIAVSKEARSIDIYRQSAPMLIRSEVAILQTMTALVAQIDSEIHDVICSDAYLSVNIQLLKTIPGIAEYSAAVILSEIGDFTSFKKAKQLVAFFGLDPSVHQSGNFSGTNNKISKRGSSYLRSVLSLVAQVAISRRHDGEYRNPTLVEYYRKKRESKPAKVAMCAVMHKLVNIVFAVLRDQKPFTVRTPEEHLKLLHSRSIAA